MFLLRVYILYPLLKHNYVTLDLSYSLLFLKIFYIFLFLMYATSWIISSHSLLPQFTIPPSRSPLFHLTYPISLITFPKVIFSCSAIISFLIAVTFYDLIFFFKYLHILKLKYANILAFKYLNPFRDL